MWIAKCQIKNEINSEGTVTKINIQYWKNNWQWIFIWTDWGSFVKSQLGIEGSEANPNPSEEFKYILIWKRPSLKKKMQLIIKVLSYISLFFYIYFIDNIKIKENKKLFIGPLKSVTFIYCSPHKFFCTNVFLQTVKSI